MAHVKAETKINLNFFSVYGNVNSTSELKTVVEKLLLVVSSRHRLLVLFVLLCFVLQCFHLNYFLLSLDE